MSQQNNQTYLLQGVAIPIQRTINNAFDFSALFHYRLPVGKTVAQNPQEPGDCEAEQCLKDAAAFATARSPGLQILTYRGHSVPLTERERQSLCQLSGGLNNGDTILWGEVPYVSRVYLACRADSVDTTNIAALNAWSSRVQDYINAENRQLWRLNRAGCTYSRELQDTSKFFQWRKWLKNNVKALWNATINRYQMDIEAELRTIKEMEAAIRCGSVLDWQNNAAPIQNPAVQWYPRPLSGFNPLAPSFQAPIAAQGALNPGLSGQHRTNEVTSQAASTASTVQNSLDSRPNAPVPGFHVVNHAAPDTAQLARRSSATLGNAANGTTAQRQSLANPYTQAQHTNQPSPASQYSLICRECICRIGRAFTSHGHRIAPDHDRTIIMDDAGAEMKVSAMDPEILASLVCTHCGEVEGDSGYSSMTSSGGSSSSREVSPHDNITRGIDGSGDPVHDSTPSSA